MPGHYCGISGCESKYVKSDSDKENATSFFNFPKDVILSKEWLILCEQKSSFESKVNKRVCSKHFKLEDFEDGIKSSIMGLRPRKLKKDAIPSLNLPNETKHMERTERVGKRIESEGRKLLVENLLRSVKSAQECGTEHDNPAAVDTNAEFTTTKKGFKTNTELGTIASIKVCEMCENLKQKLKFMEEENAGLIKYKQECLALERKFERLKMETDSIRKKRAQEFDHFTRKIRALQKENNFFKTKLADTEKKLKKSEIKFEEQAKVAFKDFLSANQIAIAMKKKSKARWTQDELSKAFTIRYLSKRCYVFFREKLKYPLPGISTLQHWAEHINLKSGILKDVLNVMEAAGRLKTDFNKLTALSYDEVKITSVYEYDQKEDEIVGPHNYMQVVMARGLFDNWKQPVYIAFDQKMTKEILDDLIIHLDRINYHVVACVSDCGGGNQGLWNTLKIMPEHTFYNNPVTDEPIFFFADVPHLLKLTRNWFLDTGFIFKDGTIINVEPVKKLLEICQTEVSSCHKLSELHIKCEKTQRQNVKLAVQLLSHTTATALKHYLPGQNKILAQNVGNFFEIINDWFDVMNSYTSSASLTLKKPYGLCLEQQNDALEKMKTTMTDMLCIGKKGLQVFQKGVLISTNSLQGLYSYLKNKYDCFKFILTHRVNQDYLENFFSQLRTRGGLHDHPSPLNAIYRIRMIILGKNPGMLQIGSNVTLAPMNDSKEDGEYLLASALKQAKVKVNIEAECPVLEEKSITPNFDIMSDASSSSLSSLVSSNKPEGEKDGLIYIAGYLARKHKKKYPQLGQYTYVDKELEIQLNTYAMPSWLQNLSFGGLTQPSDDWINTVNRMEKYFCRLHKDGFVDKKNILANTMNYISNKLDPPVPIDLLKSFCNLRIFIRIKFLNHKKQEEIEIKRKLLQEKRQKRLNPFLEQSSSSKIAKKMRRIVN